MLCHGNAFWAGLILLAWYLLDYGRAGAGRPVRLRRCSAAWLLTFGPYLRDRARAMARRAGADRQLRGGSRAGLAAVVRAASDDARESSATAAGTSASSRTPCRTRCCGRFRLATVVGIVALVVRVVVRSPRRTRRPIREAPRRLLILAVGGAFIFAGFINNKVPVYLPHLLDRVLAGGRVCRQRSVTVPLAAARSALDRRARCAVALWLFIVGYGGAGVAYYEKWYSSARKSELVPYEATSATLRALVPAGPKYLYASPQFWTPFHDEPGTTFYSYAAAQPVGSASDDDAGRRRPTIGRSSSSSTNSSGCRSSPGIDVVDLGVAAVVDRFHRAALRARRRGARHRARHDRAVPVRPGGSACRRERCASSAARREYHDRRAAC